MKGEKKKIHTDRKRVLEMLITFLGDGILYVGVCFHNEHVSFAATNPIESRRGPSISGPSLVSNTRKPGRAELTPPETE